MLITKKDGCGCAGVRDYRVPLGTQPKAHYQLNLTCPIAHSVHFNDDDIKII